MTVEKNLNAMGIKLHRGTLVDWKILEVDSLFYICPSPVGFSALHDGSLELNSVTVTLRGESNTHVRSRVLPNVQCFINIFKEMLEIADKMEWKGATGNGIPLVWDNCVDPKALGFKGYLPLERLIIPFKSLELAETFLKSVEADLLLNSTGKSLTPNQIENLTYFKKWLLCLKNIHGVEVLCSITGLSKAQLNRVIKSGNIHYPIAVKLKYTYSDTDVELIDRLIKQNSLEIDPTLVDYNHRKFVLNIRALRIFSGLTQKEIITLGVSLPCIGNVEHGKRKINMAELDELVLLYRIHGVPIRSQYTDYYNELIKETYKTFRIHLKDRGEV